MKRIVLLVALDVDDDVQESDVAATVDGLVSQATFAQEVHVDRYLVPKLTHHLKWNNALAVRDAVDALVQWTKIVGAEGQNGAL